MIELIGKKLYQWDTNRKVKVILSDEYERIEVHFASATDEKALVLNAEREGASYIASIPNILLQRSVDLYVYVVVANGDGEETIDRRDFQIKRRQKPEDYVYTETEVFSYKALEEKIPTKLSQLEIDMELGAVKTVDGNEPDKNGNVEIETPKQVQPDYNQNDPTAPDYIKHRPFYETRKETVIIEEKSGVMDFENEENFLITPLQPFEVGKEYTVMLNGVEYKRICNGLAIGDKVVPCLGNSLLLNGVDNGEPFAIFEPEQDMWVFYVMKDGEIA